MIKFEYKCRKCGVVHDDSGINTTQTRAIVIVADALEGKSRHFDDEISTTCLHHCTESSVGVADLIGFREE